MASMWNALIRHTCSREQATSGTWVKLWENISDFFQDIKCKGQIILSCTSFHKEGSIKFSQSFWRYSFWGIFDLGDKYFTLKNNALAPRAEKSSAVVQKTLWHWRSHQWEKSIAECWKKTQRKNSTLRFWSKAMPSAAEDYILFWETTYTLLNTGKCGMTDMSLWEKCTLWAGS